jgi:hypothetical protein
VAALVAQSVINVRLNLSFPGIFTAAIVKVREGLLYALASLRFNQRLIICFLGNVAQKREGARGATEAALGESVNVFARNSFDIRRNFGNGNLTTEINLTPCEAIHA